MFQRIFFAALISGVIAGLFVSAVHSFRVLPLMRQAEEFEAQRKEPVPPAEDAGGGLPRFALTLVSNCLAAIGFALLLVACFALRGNVDGKKGILWGIGGFAVFSLAPSVGLSPVPPGAFAAAVADRQIWWVLTVAGASSGLILLVFKPGSVFKALGVVLILSPHALGTPHPDVHGGAVPDALARSFVLAALAASAMFWIVLGFCAGYFFNRLFRE